MTIGKSIRYGIISLKYSAELCHSQVEFDERIAKVAGETRLFSILKSVYPHLLGYYFIL